MKVYVTIRTNKDDGPYLDLNESQVKEFYDKIVTMRGYPKKADVNCGCYAGIRLIGKTEKWIICKESVSLLNSDKEEIFLIDENRELERWVIELCKPHLDQKSIDIVEEDLNEVLIFNEGFCS